MAPSASFSTRWMVAPGSGRQGCVRHLGCGVAGQERLRDAIGLVAALATISQHTDGAANATAGQQSNLQQ
ncbi:hypothetical protein [Pseudarthrobacter sp. YAF2]|uniref:hypothetical protein n=1 Tax=Pseudarthrobacter sp. YAF2 TaxID=3233078 RepID=UPI003F9C67EE